MNNSLRQTRDPAASSSPPPFMAPLSSPGPAAVDVVLEGLGFEQRQGHRCRFCGGPFILELFEVYDHRDFQLETCCAGFHELLCDAMVDSPRLAARLVSALGVGVATGDRLRTICDSGLGALQLDWHPTICEVTLADAKAFVRKHHAHCPKPPAGWRWGHGIRNGHELVGVAMVGRPVARRICQRTVVEVQRLCINRSVPPGLVWNCCSMLYAAAAKRARAEGYIRIITYSLADEAGTALKAAGWVCEGVAGGGSWDRKSRPRLNCGPTGPKRRWARLLKQAKQRTAPV